MHFLYAWSGENPIIGSFSAVNESTWEHLKLLFFPAVLYSVIYGAAQKNLLKYLSASAIAVYSGMLAITAGYYTYSGVIGKNIDFINILLFFIGDFVFLSVQQLLIKNNKEPGRISAYISALLLIITAMLFILWSFNPPPLAVFVSPI